MTIIEEHRTEVRSGNVQYQVTVVTRTGAQEESRVVVTVGGEGPGGELVAQGRLELDSAAVPVVAELLGGSLLAFAGGGGAGRRRTGERPAQQGRPWSEEMDAELERRWLAGDPVSELARDFERTPGGIRARLPRVCCDPEKPGNHLPMPPSLREEPGGEELGGDEF
ncbi:helix-turn-helix domain containing protein [Amycolatopsis sp. PS_44_ISF1]|uniref:helix-turn-helix domain containing protein n=1 Tax=Amycolatopsis sp. PS_44_ISF1 TaxID=2974917 RepID=UPI0028DD59C4|nr:helix-turn-helix domain containing protein [Amycolatopsis sp. PS_44_ISF1]MDT8915099.1 helix-turn-helix domain containing protein [Amycolatopsis sp. PS_44_ISF1]